MTVPQRISLPLPVQMVKLVLAVVALHLAASGAADIPPSFKELAIGAISGFVSDSSDGNTCGLSLLNETGDVKQAVEYIANGIRHKNLTDIEHALEKLEAAIKGEKVLKAACMTTVADVKAIAKALKQIHGPTDFVVHVVRNVVDDGEKIFGELMTAEKAYKKAKDYLNAGKQMGMALRRMLVGESAPHPPNSTTSPKPPAPGFKKTIAIGAAMGFVSDTPDVMSCATSLLGEGGDVKQALHDIEMGIKHRNLTDIEGALEELEAAIKGATGAVATCKKVEIDVKSIFKALKQIHGPKDLLVHVVKNFLDDGENIFGELVAADHAYKTGWDYMTCGQQLGMALRRMLVGEAVTMKHAARAAVFV